MRKEYDFSKVIENLIYRRNDFLTEELLWQIEIFRLIQ